MSSERLSYIRLVVVENIAHGRGWPPSILSTSESTMCSNNFRSSEYTTHSSGVVSWSLSVDDTSRLFVQLIQQNRVVLDDDWYHSRGCLRLVSLRLISLRLRLRCSGVIEWARCSWFDRRWATKADWWVTPWRSMQSRRWAGDIHISWGEDTWHAYIDVLLKAITRFMISMENGERKITVKYRAVLCWVNPS
jgi:hypothetical protein